ncbi:MAG: hypothetical protein IJM83_06275 [Firmicutes bacterium]|nr:hypothetical protein [Bacillota bacterium]
MVKQTIDGIEYRLKAPRDLTFIRRYGTVFSVIDETGSGCICFGVGKGEARFFIKIAGADTIEGEVTPEEAVRDLKKAVDLYTVLKHPALIRLIEHYPEDDLYVAVFEWVDGEGLFDHWNFDKYERLGIQSPNERFKALPAEKKIAAAMSILSFFETVAAKGYRACDFYDGSLIYDFEQDHLTICDIDLFLPAPVINETGEDYWGTKRLKAPEEYQKGAVIDEATNVFTLGAMFFDFFGKYTEEQIRQRYQENAFAPCTPEQWTLCEDAYRVLLRATMPDRGKRYQTIHEFAEAFRRLDEYVFK